MAQGGRLPATGAVEGPPLILQVCGQILPHGMNNGSRREAARHGGGRTTATDYISLRANPTARNEQWLKVGGCPPRGRYTTTTDYISLRSYPTARIESLRTMRFVSNDRNSISRPIFHPGTCKANCTTTADLHQFHFTLVPQSPSKRSDLQAELHDIAHHA